MKVLRLTEKIKNLNRVIDNKTINAVTEMNPVMSDAYEDSLELDQAIENELKDSDLLVKDKPFLGASKQPTPKKIEDPKLNLDVIENCLKMFQVESIIYLELKMLLMKREIFGLMKIRLLIQEKMPVILHRKEYLIFQIIQILMIDRT